MCNKIGCRPVGKPRELGPGGGTVKLGGDKPAGLGEWFGAEGGPALGMR